MPNTMIFKQAHKKYISFSRESKPLRSTGIIPNEPGTQGVGFSSAIALKVIVSVVRCGLDSEKFYQEV